MKYVFEADDLKTVNLVAFLCEGSYEGYEEFKKLAIEKDLVLEGSFIIKSTEVYYLIDSDDVHYFVIRGTEITSPEDIKNDLNIEREIVGDGFLHQGFFDSTNEVYFILVHLISRLIIQGKKIRFTGHSKGAAECMVAIYQLAQTLSLEKVEFYSFGMPRVSDKGVARAVDEALGDRFYRIVNDRDLVPMLPPTKKYGFTHFTPGLFMNEKGDVLRLRPGVETKIFVALSAAEDLLDKRHKNKLSHNAKDALIEFGTDHKMAEYRKSIQKVIEKNDRNP